MKKKKEYVELSFLYFRYRNLYDTGFQRYSFFRNLIAYICNISDYGLIRRIFEELSKRNVFNEKKEDTKIFYLFNPFNREIKNEICDTISWN